MYKTVSEQKKDLLQRISFLLIAICVLLLIGSIFFYIFEDWTFKEAFHYAVISLTSRGYSNFFPKTWPAILFSAIYTLIGVGFVIYSFSTLIAHYITYYENSVQSTVTRVRERFKKEKPKSKWVFLQEK